MLLSEILGKYPLVRLKGDKNIDITGLEHDSRKVKEGYLFVAQRGFTVDGHDYIKDAIEKGAVAVVKDREVELGSLEGRVTLIDVLNSTDALGYFASRFYKQPWTRMRTIGITGTNGKTTTSYILKRILEIKNEKVGIIGTMGVIINREKFSLPNTTPDSLEIQRNLSRMVENKIDTCIMEVSSHALDLRRVKYMDFDVSLFINLSQDHLDYHEDMESYYRAKLRLFHKTRDLMVINRDDPYGKRLIDDIRSPARLITYGIEAGDIRASHISYGSSGSKFKLNTPAGQVDINLRIPGKFNIYNSLAAAATAYGLGMELELIKEGLEDFKGVRGRFEHIETNRDFDIIIDFAHTPEGIREVLKAVDVFAQGRKVIVFGAGGNRDKSKRPEMGRVAGEFADFVIITSDNPRYEDPMVIAKDIEVGVKESKTQYKIILDRKEAIKYAIMNSMPKDIILITGKGHEDTIIVKDQVIPFDERQIVLEMLDKI
ncbi:MAG: UDP-N-acetylmuramoyl-L-alanyl-D-glutamate--2,6-diaminopimelate ligase [Tissierellia bacterium]|nr:UDP-N-acetylmuramoyl-L-alanyl-D-glutamate--2,6-diaminopimelate ligase [Tissierellia bacterium]